MEVLSYFLSAAGLILQLTKMLKEQPRKGFTYEVTWLEKVIGVEDAALNGLELRYQGQPVEDVYLSFIKFQNSGRVPIAKGDYEGCLTVVVDDKAKVLLADVAYSNRTELVNHMGPISYKGNRVYLPARLLNPRDSFTIKLLTEGHPGRVLVLGRIYGVSQIRDLTSRNTNILLFGGILMFVGGLIQPVMFSMSTAQVTMLDLLTSTASTSLGLLIIFLWGWDNRYRRKKRATLIKKKPQT